METQEICVEIDEKTTAKLVANSPVNAEELIERLEVLMGKKIKGLPGDVVVYTEKTPQIEKRGRGRPRKIVEEFAKIGRPSNWTEKEIDFIKTNRSQMTMKEIASSLGRTLDAVKTKLKWMKATGMLQRGRGRPRKVIGLQNEGYAKRKQQVRWTDKERRYLLKHARQKSWKDIANHLGKTRKQCYDQHFNLTRL